MSSIDLSGTTFRPESSSLWSQLKSHFAEWRSYARSRHELMTLSDHDLLDIGITRIAALVGGDVVGAL